MVYEYFYSITKKVLVTAGANTRQSQNLPYICFLKPQIVFVLVCYQVFVFCWFYISLTKRLHCFLYLRHERSNNLETLLLFIYEYIFIVMEHELNLT